MNTNKKTMFNNLNFNVMKSLKFLSVFFIAGLSLTACSDDDDNTPEPVNEEEVITDVSLTFTNDEGQETTYTFTDPQFRDDSYVAPVISLTEGETYQVEADFFNNSNPQDPEVITEEIQEEADDHFLIYQFNNATVDLMRTDGAASTDSNGIQIGLSTVWTATATSNGSVVVSLIHEAETKDTSDGYGSFTGGGTDAEVSFDLEIQ